MIIIIIIIIIIITTTTTTTTEEKDTKIKGTLTSITVPFITLKKKNATLSQVLKKKLS